MILHIMLKEILEEILSLRFVLSLLLVICLSAAGGFVFVDGYRQQTQDYWNETNENLSAFSEQAKQLYELAFYRQEIYRKPKLLTLCAEAFEESLPNNFRLNVFTFNLPQVKGQSNFTIPYFSSVDWVFIVSLILSFVALLLTYDSFCGEKEAGTLRLMLAGSIPRHNVLIAKYLGAMFAAGIPLLIGLLISLIIVALSKDITINTDEWLRILTIVVLSFLYLSIFVFLGMFVSTRTIHSANCMVILLLVWVGLVVLIPSLGRIVSDVTSRSPGQEEFRRRLTEAEEQVNSDVAAGKYGENAGRRSPNPKECNPPARARYINASTDAENRVIKEHHNKMVAQAFAGRNLTCISPAVIYQRASEAIAGTGINHCVSLFQQIKQYQSQLKEYIRNRDRQDPDSLHLLFDEENSVAEWNAISKRPVSFDTVPKFQERDLALGQSLKLAIWDIGLLALFNLVFFAASFVSFLRYDVR